MQSNRGRDTRPEVALRKLLWSKGLRYRVATRPVAAMRFRADIVFRRSRVAVDVRGCFWHGCPLHYQPPVRNGTFWRSKLDENVARDARNASGLEAYGWLLVVVWEHDDFFRAADRIAELVALRRSDRVSLP
jgi:DNA mismatch endonuclease (patch repair protein)